MRLHITRFPGRLILAFHFLGEGTDFAPAPRFLRKRHGLGIRTSLGEEPHLLKTESEIRLLRLLFACLSQYGHF
jgi:hypothetical protein